MGRRHLTRGLVALLLSASTVFGAELIPHRAYGFGGPENSIAAIEACDERGLDAEIDVRYTKDNIPIIMHDKSLKRTVGLPGNVSDYTAEQITNMHLRNSTEKVPTLEQALGATHHHLILHIKDDTIIPALEVVERTHKMEQAYFFLNRAPHYDEARTLLPIHPGMHIVMRIMSEADIKKKSDIPYDIALVGRIYRSRVLDELHREGKKTIAFAVPHFFARWQMHYCKKHYVTAIETDNPQRYAHIKRAQQSQGSQMVDQKILK